MTAPAFVPVGEVWQQRGLCAQTDPEAFFPVKGGPTRNGKRICAGCEVRAECLEYALSHDERFGTWGGMSERERRPLHREMAKVRAHRNVEDYLALRAGGLLDSQIAARLGIRYKSLLRMLYRHDIAPQIEFVKVEGER
jgi:hypothetical protein